MIPVCTFTATKSINPGISVMIFLILPFKIVLVKMLGTKITDAKIKIIGSDNSLIGLPILNNQYTAQQKNIANNFAFKFLSIVAINFKKGLLLINNNSNSTCCLCLPLGVCSTTVFSGIMPESMFLSFSHFL